MPRNRAAFFDFIGMRLFTGKLGAGQVQRPDAILDLWRIGARRIINGRDRAELVAGYGRTFHAALGALGERAEM